VTINWVPVCEVGASARLPPKLTVESAVKFVPVSFKRKDELPAVAVVGLMLLSVGIGDTPVPVSAIESVLNAELFAICKLAARAPAWIGANFTPKTQDLPAAKFPPAVQVVVVASIVKSAASAPAGAKLDISKLCPALKLFAIVTVWAAD